MSDENKKGCFPVFANMCAGVCTCGCLTLFLFFATLTAVVFAAVSCGTDEVRENIEKTTSAFSGGQKIFPEKVLSEPVKTMKGKIAVIRVRGVILSDDEESFHNAASAEKICEMLREAEKDCEVKAVILDMNTPGGEVTASDRIYHEVLQVRKKKPVGAMMNSMCCSGGYYIAAGCKPVIASASTLTGSIGVIISGYNFKGLFDKLGLKAEVYTSGKMKDILNPARDRRPDEIEIIQKLVMSSYEDFSAIVAKGRNIPVEDVRSSEIGDGRIFDGKQALALKLVDSLGYFKDAVAAVAKEAKIKPENCKVVLYEEGFSFSRLWNELSAGSGSARLVLSPDPSSASSFRPKPGVLYYLPAGY